MALDCYMLTLCTNVMPLAKFLKSSYNALIDHTIEANF